MTYDLTPTTSTYESTNGGVRDQARQVGADAANAGGQVAGTAKEQGKEVVSEATRQARNLYGEARNQLTAQSSQQQQRAAGGLRSLAEEMRTMAQNGGGSGPVTELAHQAADRVHGVAGWLEQREPGDLLNEVKSYARRNPGTFLVGAALLGVVAGRLTRNISALGDGPTGTGSAYDPDRTAVIPTPPAPRAVPDAVPPGGYLDPQPGSYADPNTGYADPTPGGYTDPTRGGYAEPTGIGQPLPPVSQTDPLPGVPSSGTTRP
ncbi:hypothetical protein AB0H57_27715 [Micromonospora sp. NPDC050686]|uniref:hypothetical protein n=1 Tax=Micromonospora sp. NPDC050686 TaxID=3154631 RepID=UPI0033F9DAD6